MVSLGWHVVPLLLQKLGQLTIIRHLFEQIIYSNLQHTIYISKTFVNNQINLKKIHSNTSSTQFLVINSKKKDNI